LSGHSQGETNETGDAVAAAALQIKGMAIANTECLIASVHISFWHCEEESQKRRIRCVNCWAIRFAILAVLPASLAVAEDFTTINGKIYKDATISRVESDGIVVRTKTGISKIYFVELPKDVQERFLPSPAKSVAAPRERKPAKIETKQDESPQTDRRGLPAGLLISAGFIRLFFAIVTVIITGVVLAFIRSRFR
jgi:hypothetical protein